MDLAGAGVYGGGAYILACGTESKRFKFGVSLGKHPVPYDSYLGASVSKRKN